MWYDNDISKGIMTKKYLHEGEEPSAFLPRVASIFSPKLRGKALKVLENADFLPAGRTLFGAGYKGERKVSMSNCFLAGTKVATRRGLLNIEDVIDGDEVMTSNGYRVVNAVMSREFNGDLFKLKGCGLYDDIMCTPNHRFLTNKGWTRADRLFKGSLLMATPNYEIAKKYDDIDFGTYFISDDKNRLAVASDDKYVAETNGRSHGWDSYAGIPVNKTAELDNDMRYFIGRWLGDGSTTCRKGKRNPSILQIVFNATTEKEAAKRIAAIGEKAFGFAPQSRQTKQNTIAVRWESPIITSWFRGEFGFGCDGKHLPKKYDGDMQIALGLLDSDGMIKSHGAVSITLKNPGLIKWLRDTLFANGINTCDATPTCHNNTMRLDVMAGQSREYLCPNMSKTYYDNRESIKHSPECAKWIRLSAVEIVENQHTTVYNLSVEENHQYNVNGVICHNCYILPTPEDNIESIFETAKRIARISSYGGGCGVDISKLRPKDAKVNNSAMTSTGAVSFLNLFDVTGSTIGQQGRRAALMVGLSCDHPDIEEFLHVKQRNEKLASMNISIKFTDEFMEAVRDGKEFTLKFDAPSEHIEKSIDARKFFNEFCETQWDYGDPGAMFIDRINSFGLLSDYDDYHIDITNPCAEYPGNGGNSCNLGSINLYNVIDDKFTDHASVNYDKLKDITSIAIEALDEILDYGYDMQPLDINRQCISDWRSIGLGVFGLADALVAMEIRYGSQESREVVSDIMETIFATALETSASLAKAKGTFGKYRWEATKESPLIKAYMGSPLYDYIERHGLRNGSLISVAPTGTISLFAGGFTGGVEPMYQVSYERTTHSTEDAGKKFTVYARGVRDLLEFHGLHGLTTEQIKARFPFVVESHEIAPLDRVALQGVMQDYVDCAISSTVNLPNSATPQDIYDIYMEAWKQGCKGITVFRDGCKRGNILGVKETSPTYNTIEPAKRRDTQRVNGSTFKQSSSCVPSMYVTVNKADSGDIFEVFTNASGGCQANISTITRLISLALRSGIKVDKVIEELRENRCPACQMLRKQGKNVSLSCGNAIADAIQAMMGTQHTTELVNGNTCPECGKVTLRPEGHCVTCTNCGWSKCE